MFPKIFKTPKSNRKSKGQKQVFEEIWNERNHNCEICLQHIREPKTFCFAHILSKGRYPEYKFLKQNIALVCSIECHEEMDSRNAHNDFIIKKSYESYYP